MFSKALGWSSWIHSSLTARFISKVIVTGPGMDCGPSQMLTQVLDHGTLRGRHLLNSCPFLTLLSPPHSSILPPPPLSLLFPASSSLPLPPQFYRLVLVSSSTLHCFWVHCHLSFTLSLLRPWPSRRAAPQITLFLGAPSHSVSCLRTTRWCLSTQQCFLLSCCTGLQVVLGPLRVLHKMVFKLSAVPLLSCCTGL